MSTAERWRDIEGFPNHQVSNLGRVINWATETILKPQIQGKMVPRVNLMRDGKPWKKGLAQLVAKAWVPNPHGYDTVAHQDKDKTNCVASNLVWVPHTYHYATGKPMATDRALVQTEITEDQRKVLEEFFEAWGVQYPLLETWTYRGIPNELVRITFSGEFYVPDEVMRQFILRYEGARE